MQKYSNALGEKNTFILHEISIKWACLYEAESRGHPENLFYSEIFSLRSQGVP